jgi:hypothetical protein
MNQLMCHWCREIIGPAVCLVVGTYERGAGYQEKHFHTDCWKTWMLQAPVMTARAAAMPNRAAGKTKSPLQRRKV